MVLDIEDLLREIDTPDIETRRGVGVLLQSQLTVLQQVDRELEKNLLTQRLRALTQSAVGVLPALLNSVQRSNRESALDSIDRCRGSVNALATQLIR